LELGRHGLHDGLRPRWRTVSQKLKKTPCRNQLSVGQRVNQGVQWSSDDRAVHAPRDGIGEANQIVGVARIGGTLGPRGPLVTAETEPTTTRELLASVVRRLYKLGSPSGFTSFHNLGEVLDELGQQSTRTRALDLCRVLADRGWVEARITHNDGAPVRLLAEGQLEVERSSETSAAGIAPHSVRAADPRRVFVVHGRDLKLARALFDFLRALGLDPIEWTEALSMTGEGAPYVGRVIEVAFDKAQAVVVLLTPDEEVRLRVDLASQATEQEVGFQARPNVLFEAGRAFATHANRTILVSIGEQRPFSDVVGRHTLRLDNSAATRNDMASRLETAGCAVKRGAHYLDAGDFEAPRCSVAEPAPAAQSAPPTTRDVEVLESFLTGPLAPDELAGKLRVTRERANFEIESLQDKGLLDWHQSFKWGAVFGLSKKARQVLVERGRL
jgi:predicted nucleotide-binding protein